MARLRIGVGPAGALPHGRTVKFSWEDGGRRRQGFVLNYHGLLRAYVNECAHIPTGLDRVEDESPGSGRFFDGDCRYLVCGTHGALYEPDSGYCVSGPPCGASLEPLRVEVEGEEVVVYVEVEGAG